MEITIGKLKLTTVDGGGRGAFKKTTIIIHIVEGKNYIDEQVDADELKAAIKALEESCYRP